MKLLFILTFKGSIKKWFKEGVANREMEIPMEYLRRGYFTHIQIFSYSPDDREEIKKLNYPPELLDRIELICPDQNPGGFFAHLRHSVDLKKIRAAVKGGGKVAKTNQINGCWTALLAKFCGAKMFLRCGYILSRRLFMNKQYVAGVVAWVLEFFSFNIADIASVTTQDALDYIKKFMIFGRDKAFVAPTYVNTTIFSGQIDQKPAKPDVIFVGRLETQKNVFAFLRACALAQCPVTMVGKGSLEAEAMALVKELGLKLTHHPALQNEEIAALYRQHRYFVLPSLHEGLPKVLIEAMAAEMVCIGTPTSGITDLIQPGKTGFMAADFTPEAIAKAMIEAQNDPKADTYAKAARQWVLDHHSIGSYVDREFGYIQTTLKA